MQVAMRLSRKIGNTFKTASAILLLAGCTFGQSKLDIHGLHVGMPIGFANQLIALHGGTVSTDSLDPNLRTANFKDDFSVEFGVSDGKIEYLIFRFHYLRYVEQLARGKAKWGAPTYQGTETLMNQFGAKYPYRYARWETKTEFAKLSERSTEYFETGNMFVTSRKQKKSAPQNW
jgi:hypothetical protein